MNAAESNQSPPSELLQAGDLLGRYQLLCPIARGGMGQVWAARQSGPLGLPKLVAIKTAIPLESTSYAQVQEFLFDEAQVAASVDHPNVCKILELGHERNVLFIAMEWLNGAPLSTLVGRLPQRRLEPRLAAYLVAQACSGLHAAHELKDDDGDYLEVVHRDATPHNFMITAAGELKVMDFGIVKSKNQQHQATQNGELKGKLSYLAPEQIRGHGVDRRADIFTLGCVLYQITVGKSAFNPTNAQDAGQTILRILDGNYSPPSTAMPEYPPKLEAIVARALATNAAERFQTAEEMRLALEDFLADGSRPVTREEVSALLHRCCGVAIEQRRAEIRSAQKLFDSQAGQARSGTFPSTANYDFPTPLAPSSVSLPLIGAATTTMASESMPQALPVEPPRARPRWPALLGGVVATAALAFVVTPRWLDAEDEHAASAGEQQAPPARVVAATIAAAPATSTSAAPAELEQAAAQGAQPVAPENTAPRATRKPSTVRGLANRALPLPSAAEAPGSPSAPPRVPADSAVFSQPVSRHPARHTIDETDPFGK
jgi:serine/threonine-protein kinase